MTTPPPPPGFQPPGPPPGTQGQVPGSGADARPGSTHPAPAGWSGYPEAHAAPPTPVRQAALPSEPVEYQHILHGPRRAWWRPIVSFLLVLGGILTSMVALLVAGFVYLAVSGGDTAGFDEIVEDFNNPVIFGVQNLWLAALIPLAMIATWIAHGVRPGFVSSVVGRFRWGWFGWCLLVTVPLWIAYIGVATLVDGGGIGDTAGRPSTWLALLVLTFLTTPLQAAGEEYLFRGWLMQQVGAYVKNTYAALAIAIVLSSVVFALAHTSLDPWILIDLGGFATAAVVLTWRTGGLEAAVALHIVNNVIVLILAILTTGLADSFITSDTTSDPLTTVMSLVALTITTAVLWWFADRRGVARRTGAAHDRGEVAVSRA